MSALNHDLTPVQLHAVVSPPAAASAVRLRAAWPEPAPSTARSPGPAELVARLADVVQRLEALEARFTTTQVAR